MIKYLETQTCIESWSALIDDSPHNWLRFNMTYEVEADVGGGDEQAQSSHQDKLPAACDEDAEKSREHEASAPVDESESILQRLALHLSKPDKFVKASKLLRRLLVQPEKSMALDGKTVPHMQSK